jgi:single-strand DNA-binding protein
MISATVSGNIGRDAEQRKAGNYDVVSFTLASKGYANGQKTTDWVRVSWFGKRAIGAVQYLTKGCSVVVRGTLSVREYESQGTKKTSIELKADDVEILTKAASSSDNAQQEQNFEDGGF